MNLLDYLIELYESHEEMTLDDAFHVLHDLEEYKDLSKGEQVKLRREFVAYVRSWEENSRVFEQRQYRAERGLDYTEERPDLLNDQRLRFENADGIVRQSRKKYVEAFINNISVPGTIEELEKYYLSGNDAQLLRSDIYYDGKTRWTTPRWAKRGDIVLFMHTKTARSSLTSLRTEVRSWNGRNAGRAKRLEAAIADQLAFHKIYGGKIFAVGRVNDTPKKDPEDDNTVEVHYKSRIYCDIDDLFLLDQPIDISEFNSFITVSRGGSITPIFGESYEKLREIIVAKNDVPLYFRNSYSTPIPHSYINSKNWMKIGMEYRNAFTLEIQFRQCYTDYLLKEISDRRTLYRECPCHKGTASTTYVDNVIRIKDKFLPVEIKLNIEAESDLKGQCEQYCKLDRLTLEPKSSKEADMGSVIGDKVLVIDTYGVYLFFLEQRQIKLIYDLEDLQSDKNLHELKAIIVRELS